MYVFTSLIDLRLNETPDPLPRVGRSTVHLWWQASGPTGFMPPIGATSPVYLAAPGFGKGASLFLLALTDPARYFLYLVCLSPYELTDT
jgi:hypothetical protein